jgi:hypothetical protein
VTNPHIDELLADPIIQMVMKADRVEPQALKGLIARAAASRPGRALAFNPQSVRLPGQARPALRLEPTPAYKRGESCLCC